MCEAGAIGLSDKGHLADADSLGRDQHLAHKLISNIRVAADVHFRLRFLARNAAQVRQQLILARFYGRDVTIPPVEEDTLTIPPIAEPVVPPVIDSLLKDTVLDTLRDTTSVRKDSLRDSTKRDSTNRVSTSRPI